MPFLSASGLPVVVFLYWWPQLPLTAIAKGLLGLATAPFIYPFEPGSGGALCLIARLGGLHHFLLISSELLTALWIVSSLSLFEHFFWLQHVFCFGTMTKSTLDKFPKASQFRCLENWDYYFNLSIFFFFIRCYTIHQSSLLKILRMTSNVHSSLSSHSADY